jgi:hypothetical protein
MKIVCHTVLTDKGLLLEFPSSAVKSQMQKLHAGAEEKSNGYMTVDIARVYKSRTTGEGSQNNKFYALVTAICNETGNDMEDVKDALKERAIKRGYPYRYNELTGKIKPYSTTQVNTVEMGYLIDEAIQLCSELGIILSPDMEAEKPEKNETESYDIF